MNRILLSAIFIIVLGVTGCSSGSSGNGTASCNAPQFNSQTAVLLLTRWGEGLQKYNAMNNGDIYISAGNFTMSYYEPNAVLEPTLSAQIRVGTQQIYNYFIGFLSENPTMSFNAESNISSSLGCGFGAYDGYYNFVVYPGTVKESSISARFTFIYEYLGYPFTESFIAESGSSQGQNFTQNNSGNWYILAHQSSILPKNN